MENPVNKWRFIAGKIIYKWAIFHGYANHNQRVLSVVHMFDETKSCVVGFLCNSMVAEEQQLLSVETSTHGSRVTNPKKSVVGENSL